MHKKLLLISLFFLVEQTAFAAGNTKNETMQDSEISQNDFTSTSTSTSVQSSEDSKALEKRIRETFLSKTHAVLGCQELMERILWEIPYNEQGAFREVLDYFQFPKNSSFTYTQETQQKIQQQINDGSTNPDEYSNRYVTELTLKVKPQSEEEWKALDQKFPHIQVLNAQSLGLNTEDITFLVKLFPYLTSLDISRNFKFNFTSETRNGDASVQALSQNTRWNLQTLHLSCNNIGAEGAQALAANTSWNLQTLHLSCNNIGAEGAQALAANTSWDLQTLDLSGNKIRVAGAQALAQNTSWNLQTLNLFYNSIGDQGAAAIAQNTSWNLKILFLSANKIGDTGAEALAQNTSWNLQTLDLCENSIGDQGVAALAQNTSWNLQALKFLVNKIGDAGAQTLAANTSWNLQALDLSCNNIGVAGIQALRNSPYLRSTRVTY